MIAEMSFKGYNTPITYSRSEDIFFGELLVGGRLVLWEVGGGTSMEDLGTFICGLIDESIDKYA